jgi:hypothetical protein
MPVLFSRGNQRGEVDYATAGCDPIFQSKLLSSNHLIQTIKPSSFLLPLLLLWRMERDK